MYIYALSPANPHDKLHPGVLLLFFLPGLARLLLLPFFRFFATAARALSPPPSSRRSTNFFRLINIFRGGAFTTGCSFAEHGATLFSSVNAASFPVFLPLSTVAGPGSGLISLSAPLLHRAPPSREFRSFTALAWTGNEYLPEYEGEAESRGENRATDASVSPAFAVSGLSRRFRGILKLEAIESYSRRCEVSIARRRGLREGDRIIGEEAKPATGAKRRLVNPVKAT